ncbi:MAG: 4-(cytidine 5'-diphospho)-2-C-methyl-D-erythritol kinase [Desulfobacterales bacterium]|jgi:4-diphosphocytidyl-2-C-methyl-D-erythritol kinase|nr:4-(cytidine 5'-diphospho)-2-C-methyl-D-erythritol kinase [Desulfobacterales bacterium]
MMVRILSPAKINLFLRITGRRADGYHNLLSLMCRVGLFDEIRLRLASAPVRLECSDPGLPRGEANLAVRAALIFFEALGRPAGVEISLEKRIPVSAGLGGGSSNAASVLMGLNHAHGAPFSPRRLKRMARRLGADVPFFIGESPALASGIGDVLEPCPNLPMFHIILVCPPFAVSTAEVYGRLNLRLTNCPKQITKARFKTEGFDPRRHLCNDLETVTQALHPEILSVKRQLLDRGALGALMTGSGGAVFGLFRRARDARQAAGALAVAAGWRLFAVEPLSGPAALIRRG